MRPNALGRDASGSIDVTCDGAHVGTFQSLGGLVATPAIATETHKAPSTVAYKESSSFKYATVSLKYGTIDNKAAATFFKNASTAERTCEVSQTVGGNVKRYTMVGTWTRTDARPATGMEGGEKPAPSFDVRVTSLKAHP